MVCGCELSEWLEYFYHQGPTIDYKQ